MVRGPKPRLAIVSLIILTIASGVVVARWLYAALIFGAPLGEGFYALISVVFLSMIFLPFLWRRYESGFVGTVGIGVWTLLNALFGVPGIFAGTLALEGSVIVVLLLVTSISVVVSAAAAWRGEQRKL